MDLEPYRDAYQAEHGRKAAMQQVNQNLRRFREFFNGSPVSRPRLDDYRTSLVEGLAPATRNRYLGATRAYLNWLRRRGEFTELTAEDLGELLRNFDVKPAEPVVLTAGQIRTLLIASTQIAGPGAERARRFLTIGLLTGARPGEVLALTGRDIDLERRELKVYARKTRRPRRVPFHDSPVLERLVRCLKPTLRADQRLVAPDFDGELYKHFARRFWRKLIDAAGLPYLLPKVLRSTCVAYLASSTNYSEYMLGARFGHSNKVSIDFYRVPMHGIGGSTVEELMQCRDEAAAAVEFIAGRVRHA